MRVEGTDTRGRASERPRLTNLGLSKLQEEAMPEAQRQCPCDFDFLMTRQKLTLPSWIDFWNLTRCVVKSQIAKGGRVWKWGDASRIVVTRHTTR